MAFVAGIRMGGPVVSPDDDVDGGIIRRAHPATRIPIRPAWQSCLQQVQRFLFWTDMMQGTCGFSYGVEGIWQFNTVDFRFGKSPGGTNWGKVPWEVASKYPGSTQVGLGKAILQRFDWWRLQPMPTAVVQNGDDDVFRPYSAGVGDALRIAYLPHFPTRWRRITFIGLPPDRQYLATFWDPITGEAYEIGTVVPDAEGGYVIPDAPIMQDWVVSLERR